MGPDAARSIAIKTLLSPSDTQIGNGTFNLDASYSGTSTANGQGSWVASGARCSPYAGSIFTPTNTT